MNNSSCEIWVSWRPRLDPVRLERLIEAAGWTPSESLVLSLAVYATLASPAGAADVEWIASASSRLGDPDLALEMAGVVFAFNTVNRVADARRVQLEYRFLRDLGPVRGWMERRFASLTGLVYDLSYSHKSSRSPDGVLARLEAAFRTLGTPGVPEVFDRLRPSPLVLEGVSDMIEASIQYAGVRPVLWREAIAIAVASRAISDSCLIPVVDGWLSRASSPDSKTLLSLAASPGPSSDPGLVSACRRYAWMVSNAAYTITEEQICQLRALGLSDAEVLDLTLGVTLFAALATVEPLIGAARPACTA